MSDKKAQLFFSENLDPVLAQCIGAWFRICEDATPENLLHECRNFWFGMQAFKKLSVACNNARDRDGAVHFSIASSNELREVANYIELKIGVNPIIEQWK